MLKPLTIALPILFGLSACGPSIQSPADDRLLDEVELTRLQSKARDGDDDSLDRIQSHFNAKMDKENVDKWFKIGVLSGSIKYRIENLENLITSVSTSKQIKQFDNLCAGFALTKMSSDIYAGAKLEEDRHSAIALHMDGVNLVLKYISANTEGDGIAAKCKAMANLPSKDLLEF